MGAKDEERRTQDEGWEGIVDLCGVKEVRKIVCWSECPGEAG